MARRSRNGAGTRAVRQMRAARRPAVLARGTGAAAVSRVPRSRRCDSAQQLFERQQPLRVDQLEQAQFKMEALLLAVIQIVEGAQHDLQVARQIFFGEQQRSACRACPLVGGDLQQLGLLAVELGHQRVAQVAHHLARQRRGAMSGVQQHVQAAPSTRHFGRRQRLRAGARRRHWAPSPSTRESAPSQGQGDSRHRTGAEAIAWSMMESASRIEPSPASASSAKRSFFGLDLLLRGDHLQLRQNVVELTA